MQLTGSFTAEGSDGKTYAVNVFSDSINAGTLTAPAAELSPATAEIERGPKALQTSEGRTVIWVSKGLYKILQTGVTLRSNSPDAP
jgi:hypothetical protein